MIRNTFCLTLFFTVFACTLNAQERGSSAPFISGDTFRDICDFTYDELSKDINPASVKSGSIIFLKTDFLEEFFTKAHPYIKNPYILITHNSDHPIPGNFATYLDDSKIIAWFGQNVDQCSHPKMNPIPIGIANKQWPHGNVEIFEAMQSKFAESPRSILLYMNFSVRTYPKVRLKVMELFKDKSYCVSSSQKDLSAYLGDLARSKFVLSPRGNGLDCHRTWEALLMGAIPIVETSSLDPMYENLPVVIVNGWNQIDENFLNTKYEEMKARDFQWEKIYFAYWLERIRSFKNQIKRD